MNSTTRRTLAGDFRAQDLGHGNWLLTAHVPRELQVYVVMPGDDDGAALQKPGIERLDLQWGNDGLSGVNVTLSGARGTESLRARTAIIHEAQPRLYEALPLAGFDTKARRFWQRVFLLIRVPGGRVLLRWIARRKR